MGYEASIAVFSTATSVAAELFVTGRRVLRAHRRAVAWSRRGVALSTRAIVRLSPGALLEIGYGASIGEYTVLDLTSDPLNPAGRAASLTIGSNTAINEFNNIRASGGAILIGESCLISQYVSIIAANHSTEGTGPIRDMPWTGPVGDVIVGDGVWIGAGATILPGAHIGDGAVVGAGSVVTSGVAAGTIVAGNPSRPIRLRH